MRGGFTNTSPNSSGSNSKCERQTHNQLGSVSVSPYPANTGPSPCCASPLFRINIRMENTVAETRYSCVYTALCSVEGTEREREHCLYLLLTTAAFLSLLPPPYLAPLPLHSLCSFSQFFHLSSSTVPCVFWNSFTHCI